MSVPSDDEIRQRFGLSPEASVQRVQPADGHVTAQPDVLTVVEVGQWEFAAVVGMGGGGGGKYELDSGELRADVL